MEDQPKSLKRNAFSASNAYMSPKAEGNRGESARKVDRSNAAMRKKMLR